MQTSATETSLPFRHLAGLDTRGFAGEILGDCRRTAVSDILTPATQVRHGHTAPCTRGLRLYATRPWLRRTPSSSSS